MKILEVVNNLAAGGGQRFVVDLSNSLYKNGQDVSVFTFRADIDNGLFYKDELSEGVRLINRHGNCKLLSKIAQIFSVAKVLWTEKPDIVHCHILGLPYVIIPSMIMRKTQFFYTVHNEAAKDTAPGISSWLRKTFLKKRIHAVTISKHCAKTFLDYYGYEPSAMIENGCRELSVTQELSAVQNEINSYKKSPATKVFVNIARISEQKNHKLLIEAFNKLLEEGADAVLLVIGDYRGADRIMSVLRPMIKTDRILFLGTKHNVVDYLNATEFFVLSSAWEGLPISVLEAGLSGCYPVCTPVGGIPDVIVDETWGLLSKDLTIEEFVTTLKTSMTKNIDRQSLKQKYESRYLMSLCAKKYASLFNNYLNHGKTKV